jgi:hypothetical protein
MSARLRYYNPKLDPRTQAEKMTPKMREAVNVDTYGWDTEKAGGPLNVPDADHPYNLVSSLCTDGNHRIAFDIDVPITIHPHDGGLVIEWAQSDGTTDGYTKASIARGQSLLRPPHVRKNVLVSA